MAEDMVVEHGGHSMNGAGAWFLLFFTIVLAVITGVLVLDLVSKALYGTEPGE
jgi:hypothetical protein